MCHLFLIVGGGHPSLKLHHAIEFPPAGHSSIVHEFEFILVVRPIPQLYEATSSFSPIELPPCFLGLFPILISITPLLLHPSFSPVPFHSTLPVLPNFTHPLQLPYFIFFSQTLPLDSSKLCVCVFNSACPPAHVNDFGT